MVEEECEWDALAAAEEESVVRLVVKAKIVVEEKQMKEVEGKKVMVGMMRVAAPTVAAVELKEEEVKGLLAVAVRSQVVLIHLVVRL